MSPSDHQNRPADRLWYIRVSDTVYGPFDDRTVWTYVQEGRVTALSEMSMRPDAGYQPAQNWLEIAHWFQAPIAQPVAAPEPEPEPQPIYSRRLLVMAEINSGRIQAFLDRLQNMGNAYQIGQSTWILESNADADTLKSALGPELSISDRLFIVDATQSEISRYNLGDEIEATLDSLFPR